MEKEFAVPEAAEFLGVAKSTLYWYTSKKNLKSDRKIGKNLIFYQSTLEEFDQPIVGWKKGKKRKKEKNKDAKSNRILQGEK